MKFLRIFILILVISSALGSRRFKRLAGGYSTKKRDFPYQVGLRIYLDHAELPTWCGGSIINHEWILTAAHCTQSATSVDVILGTNKISLAEISHTIDKKHILVHPAWNPFNMTNDISLVKIPYTGYSADIQPVEYPSNKSYFSSRAVATGWGSINDTNIILDDLKMATLKVMNNDDCVQAYPTSISSSSICVTSTAGGATCGGDSGGPLVLQGSRVLVGVASFTSGAGCTNGYPSVFTRVSSYLDWIKQSIKKNI